MKKFPIPALYVISGDGALMVVSNKTFVFVGIVPPLLPCNCTCKPDKLEPGPGGP
ncbi:hypothetical protein DSECCO2_323550 [anaerobic digester metagenome]